MADRPHKPSLTAELAAARAELTGYTAALRCDLDLGARIKRGVARNRAAWFGGAAVLGLLLSKIPPLRRKAPVRKSAARNDATAAAGKAAFGLTVLKFGLDFAKPALMAWAKRRFIPSTESTRAARRV